MSQSSNPFQTPRPKGIRLLQGTLRVVVAVQCFGMAAAWMHQGRSTSLSRLIETAWEPSASQLSRIDSGATLTLLVCGVLTLIRPCWLVIVPVALYQGAIAAAGCILGNGTLSLLEPAAQAARILLPIALLIVDFWPPRIRPTLFMCLSAVGLLRLAAALTFAAFGVASLAQYQNGGNLVELLQLSVRNGLSRDLSLESAQHWLGALGALNLGLALSILTSRSRGVALAMTMWGLLTAFSWTVAYGRDGYDQTLVHIADGGAPLVVLLFWLTAVREQVPVFLPEQAAARPR